MESVSEPAVVRSRVPSIVSGGMRAVLTAEDRVPIDAAHLPGSTPGGLAIVVAHGFTGALERPAVRRAAETFAGAAGVGGVVTFSFRGHGRSGGRSTVGDREVLDLDAAVRWARRLGHPAVASVGFSMGGSVVLRHAGRKPAHEEAHVDAVVSVSAPARWYYRGTAPMRRVHWAITQPVGRMVSRGLLHTRIHDKDWDPVPVPPVEAVRSIAPTPLLVVHGDRDGYFPLDHPLSLADAAAARPNSGSSPDSATPRTPRRPTSCAASPGGRPNGPARRRTA